VRKSLLISFLFLIIILISDCKKEIIVNSLNDIPGTWRWEYKCGGPNDTCIYMSGTRYATIEFRSDGKYIEKRNDTIFLQTNYEIVDSDGTFGTLILETPAQSYPVTILNSMLMITRVDYWDSYRKIKE
jgi:hypothetical protein